MSCFYSQNKIYKILNALKKLNSFFKANLKMIIGGTSPDGPMVRLHTSNVRGVGSIPGWATKIPHAAWYSPPKF